MRTEKDPETLALCRQLEDVLAVLIYRLSRKRA
jgi:hypothetical protein